MYTTLDFLVVLNARRFIAGASPELFRTTDEADTVHVVSELPIARKPLYLYLFSRLRSNPHIPCVQCERATLPILNHMPQTFLQRLVALVFITPCLSPCFVEGLARQE